MTPKLCPIHKVPLLCPACLGSQTSEAKAQAARENGRRGGRPKKAKPPP